MSTMKTYDFMFKLLMIGDSGVGKSCLLLRFTDDDFTSSFIATIGIDFKIKTMEVDNKKVKLQIWDTAGQERFRTITSAYYRGAMGILLIYDITSESTFLNLRQWMKTIEQNATTNVIKCIIGNKLDMEENREVSYNRAQQLAKEYNIEYFETSAKTGQNVNDPFTHIAKLKMKQLESEGIKSNTNNVNLNKPSNKPNKKCCV